MDAKRIMPSGICASIEPSEYNEYAIPSTTPDLSTVTGAGSSLRTPGAGRSGAGAGAFGSAKVEGVRLRRNASGRVRSDCGQASSKVAGAGSFGPGGGTGGAGLESAAGVSGVGAPRSRSLRDD